MQNNYKDLTLPKISNKPLVTSYCNNIAAGRCKHSFTCYLVPLGFLSAAYFFQKIF